jgi:RNA binding exosome subunit
VRITHIALKSFVHATEDFEKVLSCLRNLVPFNFEYDVDKSDGHFGNPISTLRVGITRQRQIAEFMGFMTKELSKDDMVELIDKLEKRLVGNKLYFRLDKMATFKGEVALGEGVQVILTVTSYPYERKGIIKGLRELLL